MTVQHPQVYFPAALWGVLFAPDWSVNGHQKALDWKNWITGPQKNAVSGICTAVHEVFRVIHGRTSRNFKKRREPRGHHNKTKTSAGTASRARTGGRNRGSMGAC